MVLTEKQRQDLHQSMLDYLIGMGDRFTETAAAFEREAKIVKSDDGAHAGLLERKWTSVIRLQRKVMELENKIQLYEESAYHNGVLGSTISRREMNGGRLKSDFLPRAPPKYSLAGHRNPITCIVFHPLYSIFCSGSEDATIKVWDFETGEYERTLKGHTNTIQAIAFNAQGSLLASTSADLTVKLWDFSTDGEFECLKTLRGHDHNVCGVIFAPSTLESSDDRLYTCSRDKTIKIWEISTGYCLETLSGVHSDWVRDIAISDDGLYLASCGNDRSIIVWNLANHRAIQSIHDHEHVVECVEFARSGAQETNIHQVHVKKLMDVGVEGTITNIQQADDTGISNEIDNSETKSNVPSINGDKQRTKFLISGSRDRKVRLWEAFTGILLMKFEAHENWVRSVKFHPNGKYIISGSEDRTIRVFDLETGRCVRTIDDAHEHFVTCVDVHASLPLLVSGGIDKRLNVWECG